MPRVLLIVSLFLIALLLVIVGWFSLRFFVIPIASPSHTQQSFTFVVIPGTSIVALAQQLAQQGILNNPYYFILLAKLQSHLSNIKAGEYVIVGSITPQQLLKKLVSGERVLHKITFVEGWTFAQVKAALAANPALTHTLKDQDNHAIMASMGYSEQNPEGLFYPDTYLFASGTKDSKILRMAYDLLQKKLQLAWQYRSPKLLYKTPYEALIVASMVEKETAWRPERPQVAGVILNRLQRGMRLQIDASVIYGLPSTYQGPLTRAALKIDTPYNTYTRQGLPPTPIAMVSESSLQAALHPRMGNALFYVAKGDGSHVFSTNFKGHRAAIKTYLIPKNKPLFLFTQRSWSSPLLLNFWLFLGQTTVVICPYTP